jgi:hypothetical protein
MVEPRNFPPPWSVEELDSCFVIKDANDATCHNRPFQRGASRQRRRHQILATEELADRS